MSRYQDIGEEDDWETADRDSGDEAEEEPGAAGAKGGPAKKLKAGKVRGGRSHCGAHTPPRRAAAAT